MRRFLNLVRHALFPRLCPECRTVVEEALLEFEEIRREHDRLRPEIQRQKILAPNACKHLLEEPKDLQVQRIRRSYTRYGTRPVVEELLRLSRKAASVEAEEARRLAELAHHAVLKITGREAMAGGQKAIPDLNALVRAHLGNACRVLCRYDEAEDHFRSATVFLVQGTGDPRVFGQVFSLYGSYLRCRRDLKGALHVLEEAEKAFLTIRSLRGRAKVLLKRAAVLEDMRQLDDAVMVVREALPSLQGERSQALRASAHHNLAFYFCELGRAGEALKAFETGESLFRSLPVPMPGTAIQRVWTHGKVRWGLGEFERAEDLLQRALEGFQKRQDPFRCALVSLDLAGVYAEQDRLEDLVAIVGETHEGLKSQGLDPEAENILKLLVESAQRRQLTLAAVKAAAVQVRRYLSCGRASC